jgi:hypothetical protein
VKWLALALLLASPAEPSVEVQRPGEPVLWALDWDAPASCPTRTDFLVRVRSYVPALEEPPLEVPRARLRIDAKIEQVSGMWTVQLAMSGEHGSSERSFSASTCEELADAVALVTAVSLDPVVTAREVAEARAAALPVAPPLEPLEDEPEPEPPVEVREPDVELVSSPPDELEPAAPREFRIALRVTGGGGFGPTLTGYGALAAGFALFGRRWRWSLDGGGWLPRTIRSEQAAGRFWGWWVGTRGCFVPRLSTVEFPLCAGLELGQVRAAGLQPALNTRAAAYPWIAASVGGGISWVIVDRVAIVADVAALVPFIAGDFQVGEQTLQRLVPVGVRAMLGLELRL